jgi:hypothetical protein
MRRRGWDGGEKWPSEEQVRKYSAFQYFRNSRLLSIDISNSCFLSELKEKSNLNLQNYNSKPK